MEEQIALLEQAVAELQLKVAQFDPATFAADVRFELVLWKDQTEGLIRNLELQLLDTIRRIDGLDALLKEADELLKKLEGIDLEGLDPEKIKQAVLAELKDWQTSLEEELAEQKAAIQQVANDLTMCKADLEAQIALLKAKDETHDQQISKLETDLAKLVIRVNEIANEGVDLALIQAEVERLINDWKLSVENRLEALENLGTEVANLTKRLDELPPILSIKEIKQLISSELSAWVITIEGKITALEDRDTALLSDLGTLSGRVTVLEQKIDAIGGGGLNEAQVKALILAELGTFQISIDLKISNLKAELLLEIDGLRNTLTTQIDGLNTRLLVVEANSGGNVNITNIVNLVLVELDAWKTLVVNRITVLEGQRVTDRLDIDNLLLGLSNLSAQVSALIILTETDVNNLIDAKLAPWIAEIDSIQLLVAQLETITDHTQDIANLQAGLDALLLILSGPLPSNWEIQVQLIVETLLITINADVAQLQLDKATLDAAVALLQTALAGLQTDLAALTVVVDNLPVPLTEAEISVLIGVQISILQADLEAQILALDLRITVLETSQANILLVITQIQTSISAQNVTINQLQILITEVKTTVLNLPPIPSPTDIIIIVNTTIANWKQEIEIKILALQACCEEGQGKIEVIEQEIEDIKNILNQSDASAIGIRLARRCLTGWGIVGGLEIKSDDACAIHLSKGSGITPRGVLLHTCEPLYFTHYRKFVKPDDDPVFKNYPLWELLVWETLGIAPGEPVPDEINPLTPQSGAESPFIEGKAVIFLPGQEQNYYLLIAIEDLVALNGKTADLQKCMGNLGFDPDMGFSEEHSPLDALPTDNDLYLAFNPVMVLPEIPLFRFGFRPPDECDPEDLDDPNFPMICSLDHLYDTWLPIIQDAFRQVDRWVKKVMEQYHELLFPQLDKEIFEGKLEMLFEKWMAFTHYNKHALPTKTKKFYVQYFYDWARDLIAGYHELRSELQILMAELCLCRPDLLLEQRPYLMLGLAVRPDQDGLAAPLRDSFHQSPIFNGNFVRLETCRLYYRREFEMIEGFYLPGYQDDLTLPCWCHHNDEGWEPDFSRLRITPSKGYIHALSRQSLPFYYPLAPNMESLHFYWEYRRAKMRQVDYHLSYHASDADDSYSHRPEVIRPLYYSFDPYDFYRIEGHVSRSFIELNPKVGGSPTEVLQYMVKRYNLDFEVIEIDISCNQCRFLSQNYPYPNLTPAEFFNSFRQDIMGAEHLAGVPKGGTFIVVTSKMVLDDVSQKVVIADFALPYRCCPVKPILCSFDLGAKMAAECEDGKRAIQLSVIPHKLSAGKFQLTMDGKPVDASVGGSRPKDGLFAYQDGQIQTISLLAPADNGVHVFQVKDIAQDCCGALDLIVPGCDCKMSVKATVGSTCVNGMVKAVVTVSVINAAAGFYLSLDGKPYPIGAPLGYSYEQDGIASISIDIPGDGKSHVIMVEDAVDKKCTATVTVKTPDCTPSIKVSVVPSDVCLPHNMTSVEVLVSTKNELSKVFLIKLDGAVVEPTAGSLTYHPGGSTALSINVLGDGGTHKVEVADSINGNLNAHTKFMVKDCRNIFVKGEEIPIHKSVRKPRK